MIKKIRHSRAIWRIIGFVIILFVVVLITGLIGIMNKGSEAQVFKAIGFGLIMVWTCIFICYFFWAIYFYNIRFGLGKKAWKKIEEAKQNRTNNKPYRQEDIDEEPKENPYKDQTFGLPTGTVRGMIAFTLLFGSIALLIVSFGMSNQIQTNGFFFDQFDFFKTAFLMMIAFYFGNHSLKYLKPATPVRLGESDEPNVVPEKPPKPEPDDSEIVVIQPDSNKDNPDEEKMPPITAIDPMAPTK